MAPRFPGPMPGESSAVPTEDRGGLNHLQTPPPSGPESVQHNPQQPVAAVDAQATRRVLLQNRQLVTKREDLRLQGSTDPKTGGQQSEKGDEKRAHRGSHHDLTNDPNPCVFRSDGIFGNHSGCNFHDSGGLKRRTILVAECRQRAYCDARIAHSQHAVSDEATEMMGATYA